MDFLIGSTGKFSGKEKQYLKSLQLDFFFENITPRIRTKIGLPVSGIRIKILPNRKLTILDEYDDNKLNIELLEGFIILFLKLYDLPTSWFYTLSTIIVFNAAISPEREGDGYKPIEYGYVGSHTDRIINRIDGQDLVKYIEIIIKEDVNFTSLISFLRKNKKDIQLLLRKLRKVPLTKLLNFNVYKKMNQFRKLSDKKLGEKLGKLNKKLLFSTDRKIINIYRKRYKKYTSHLIKYPQYLHWFDELLD